MRRKNNRLGTAVLSVIFFAGLALLLYPSVSDQWNSMHQTRAITSYTRDVAALSSEDYSSIWQQARAYNKQILNRSNAYNMSDNELDMYNNLLDITGTGLMGYIEIPELGFRYPIYHGTNESVLQIAVGHIEWTSLPVGGESSHCVLSGHRGLPSAKLFSNLDKLDEGDTFMLHILEETLTYQVDRILTVLPEETEPLLIEEGKDCCTLVTCTPYGINTHRLLVRGIRTDNADEIPELRITSDAIQISPALVAVLIAIPLLLLSAALLLTDFGKNRKESGRRENEKNI